jgi:hypothetical protein
MVVSPIIYIDGALADAIGRIGLQEIADVASRHYHAPVDVLTVGVSEHHAYRRVTGKEK